MRWSKLKSLVESRFASSLGNRVAVFSTRYGDCTCGRAWITVDGREVANFCTRAASNSDAQVQAKTNPPHGYGELSRQDAYASCWAFVHDLSIEGALRDSDPLVQALSVLDKRLGRGRLSGLNRESLHPLAWELLLVRLESEGMDAPRGLG